MKLLYNITPLIGMETGIGVYTRKIIEGIKSVDLSDSFGFFSNSRIYENLPYFDDENTVQDFNLKQFILQYTPQKVKTSYTKLLEKYVAHQLNHQFKDYIYHETNYNLLPFEGKKISTFHDLSIIHYPEYHPIERIKYFEKHLKYTLANSDHFITDSKFVKQEMINILGVNECKITSIPLGVDEIFKPRTAKEISPTLKKHKLLGVKYFLIVGSFEPRKNIQLVLRAYNQLPNSIKREYKIVHVGPEGWNNEKIWEEALSLKMKGQFINLGYLPKIEIAHIYNGATLFVYPSLYEGFGFPPLEAMASGTLVISTCNSSLSEIVNRDNAYIIDEQNPMYLKQIMENISQQKVGFQPKIEKANIRCKMFNWDNTVKNTIEVYKRI